MLLEIQETLVPWNHYTYVRAINVLCATKKNPHFKPVLIINVKHWYIDVDLTGLKFWFSSMFLKFVPMTVNQLIKLIDPTLNSRSPTDITASHTVNSNPP